MKPTNKHMALAHVWLFQADVNPEAIDTEGRPRAESLARIFDCVEQGTLKPAEHTVRESQIRPKKSLMRPRLKLVCFDDEETTAEYDLTELQRLVGETKRR